MGTKQSNSIAEATQANPTRREVTHREWVAEGERRFGADVKRWKFRCAQCGNEQTMADFAGLVDAPWFRIAVALGFIAMAAWTLVPDTFDEEDENVAHRGSAFLTTLVAFFIVELGDKTQVATVALGAQYQSVAVVAAGTTLGMMLANAPAVFLGEELVKRVSLKATRIAAALLFLALGLWQLAEFLPGLR